MAPEMPKKPKEKPFRLKSSSMAMLLLSAALVPLTGQVAFVEYFLKGDLLMGLAYGSAALGAAARTVLRVDQWAVARMGV